MADFLKWLKGSTTATRPPEEGEETSTGPDYVALRGKWTREFGSAKKWIEPFRESSKRIDGIVRAEKDTFVRGESKWNLFTANLETKMSMLYGRAPRVDVERRHLDDGDDVARVGGDIGSRFLNTDIERTSDGARTAYGYALQDRLEGGWGLFRARYVVETEDVPAQPAVQRPHPATGEMVEVAPATPAGKRKTFEDIETDYVHWQDQLWSPCRMFHEMRWWAQRAQMSKAQLEERFGDKAAGVPLNAKPPVQGENDSTGLGEEWKRADVWEIWDKDEKQVCWFVEDFGVLECKPDPYGLDGFFPFARPMVANATTSKYLPRPDYAISQDQHEELNRVTTRIAKLITAVRVSGAYDKAFPELEQILQDAGEGNLVPVENWGALLEKGGIAGAVQSWDITPYVNAIIQLRDYRRELVDMIAQSEGLSDLARGEATTAGETATASRAKVRMGSVRMQRIADDLARACSEHQNIRWQLACKFMDKETIAERAAVKGLPKTDYQYIGPALDLIKNKGASQYRIEVRPESLSSTDFAAQKAERTEALTALAGVMQSMAPVTQVVPQTGPLMLQAAQWMIAGMRGSSGLESAFDAAAKSAQKQLEQPQQAPPDPKQQVEQMKLQGAQMKISGDLQKEQLKHQNKLQEIQAETAAHDAQEQSQARWNTVEATQKGLIQKSLKPQERPGEAP